MSDKTTSGEPTFGIPKFKTALVQTKDGTMCAAYHNGDTWWEGRADERETKDNPDGRTPVQLDNPPVELIKA